MKNLILKLSQNKIRFLSLIIVLISVVIVVSGIAGTKNLVGKAQVLPEINVKNLGVKGDGATDDTAAINSAQNYVASTGGVLYFPAGTYLVSGNGIILKKSNIVFRGEGKDSTILRRTGTTGNILVTSSSYPGLTNFTLENLTLDRNGRSFPGYQPTVVFYGAHLAGARVSDVRFWDSSSSNLALSGMDGVIVENSYFAGRGDAIGSGVTMNNGTKNVTIRGNAFMYLSDGVGVSTLQGQYQSSGIILDNNTFDLGWWLIKAKMSGEGSTVSYTGNSLTDTAADFNSLFPLASNTVSYNIRVLPVREQGDGQYLPNSIIDVSAQFLTKGVIKGEIVRVGNVFGVVDEVVSDVELKIEGWIDNQEYVPAAPPASGEIYTVYGVYIGKLSQIYGTSTATSLSTQRWHDLNGNTVTPSNGTRYEVLVKRPNYPFHAELGTSGTQITNNRFIRGWSDQISHYGTGATVTGNTVIGGQDVGITIHGSNNIVNGNTITHQGTIGIWTFGDDNVFSGNVITDMAYENFINTISLGCIAIEGGERNLIEGNTCKRNAATNPLGRYGYIIQGVYYSTDSRYGDAVDNILRNNKSDPHTVADYYIFGRNGAKALNTRLENNIGTVSDHGVGTIIITPTPTPLPTSTPTLTPTNTPVPTSTPIPTPTSTPTPISVTVTLNPIDDAYVRSDSASSNYGSSSSLSTDNSPVRYTYLKFDLRPYAGKVLTSAVMKLKTGSDASTATQSVRTVSSTSWSEGTITYSNRPSIGSTTVGSFLGRTRLRWYDVNVASGLSGKLGQLVSFAVVSSNSDSLSIYSSESSNPPQLVVTYR